MKITFDHDGDGVHMEVERDPLPPERFRAVCRLAAAGIGGAVFLVAVKMIGAFAIIGVAVVLFIWLMYKSML